MAIQMRRGAGADFRPEKMKPGELAVTIDGTRKVYAAFAAGDVKELASKEDIWQEVEDAEKAQKAAEAAQAAAEIAESQATKAKNDAVIAQTGAETAAKKAEASEMGAETAREAAEAAENAAVKAKKEVESDKKLVEQFKNAAESADAAAQRSAETATAKATEATNSAKAAKKGQDAAEASARSAEEKASDAAASAAAADKSKTAAETSAERAETAANIATTEAAKVKTWKPVITNGILNFIVDNDPTPPEGYNVIGPEGPTPTITIGANENWFVNGVDTGKPSRGAKGDTSILTIGVNGNFYIDGEDTGQKAQGPTGPPGTDGKDGRNGVDGVSPEISISADGYWEINGTKTDKKAVPENGTNGKDGAPGAKGADGATWLFGNVAPTNQGKTGDFYINTTTYDVYSKATGAWVKTGNIKGATGPQGVPGTNGKDGAPGAKGADGKAATVSVGTVTTLQPGQPATVNNSGTENAAVLNFGIPQGQSGSGGATGGCAAFKIKKGFIADADGGIFPLVNYVQNQSVATLVADGSIDLAGPGAYTFEFNSLLELESEPNTALEVVCSVTDENYADFGDIPGSRVNGSQDASKFIYAFTGTTCYQVVASYLRVTFFLASGVKGTALRDGYLIINKISDQYPSS